MSSTEIILAILGSSLLSTGLGSWVNWEMQKRNYKKEYYKKILDKRIEAYEKIREVVSSLSSFAQQGDKVVHTYLTSEALFNNLCQKIRDSIDDSLWLSAKASSILTELNIFLINEFSNNMDKSWSKEQNDEEFVELAFKNRENVKAYNGLLLAIISNDLKNLYRIDSFFDVVGKQDPVNIPVKASKYNSAAKS